MLKFNSKRMMADLTIAYAAEIEVLTDWLWAQVQQKAPSQVDRGRIEKEIIVIGETIVGTVSASGIQALITEWGSGSLADESNPAWMEYVDSQYWNDSRNPYLHPITGRPAGSYTNLDGETKVSTGAMEGLNLERFLKPAEPQHWMREVVNLSRPYILERLMSVMQTFPMHRYFVDGR